MKRKSLLALEPEQDCSIERSEQGQRLCRSVHLRTEHSLSDAFIQELGDAFDQGLRSWLFAGQPIRQGKRLLPLKESQFNHALSQIILFQQDQWADQQMAQ